MASLVAQGKLDIASLSNANNISMTLLVVQDKRNIASLSNCKNTSVCHKYVLVCISFAFFGKYNTIYFVIFSI